MIGYVKKGMMVAALLLLIPFSGFAYDLKPIVIQLTPSGSGSAQSMVITNSHARPIAIEIKAFKRGQNPDGTDRREPEEEDIIISPPQMVIAPKSSQSIKVRWVGPSTVERELAYRIVTTQLPIEFQKIAKDGVNAEVSMNYSYEAALYILPAKPVRIARLVRIDPVKDDKGQQMMELLIASEGNSRAILRDPILTIKSQSGGEASVLKGADAKDLNNLNILAGSERRVRLPWPSTLPFGPIEGQLQTEYVILQ